MLTEIHVDFTTRGLAAVAITKMRAKYRVALRGSCSTRETTPDGRRSTYRLHVALSGSGFSSAEFASAVRQFNLHNVEVTK